MLGRKKARPLILWDNLLIFLTMFQLSPKLYAQNKSGLAAYRPLWELLYVWVCVQFLKHNFFLSLLNLLNHSVWTIFLTQISFWLLHGDTLWETCSCCLQKEYFALLKLKAYLLLLAQQLHYNDLCPLAAPWMAVHYLLLFFWFSIMYKTEILLYKPSISSSLQIMIKLMSKCSHLPL